MHEIISLCVFMYAYVCLCAGVRLCRHMCVRVCMCMTDGMRENMHVYIYICVCVHVSGGRGMLRVSI